MANWRLVAKKAILGDGHIDQKEVNFLRQALFEDGEISKSELEFLAEVRKECKSSVKAFTQLFYDSVKAHMLQDGDLDAKETKWLQKVIFADAEAVDADGIRLLTELKAGAKQTCAEFEAFYAQQAGTSNTTPATQTLAPSSIPPSTPSTTAQSPAPTPAPDSDTLSVLFGHDHATGTTLTWEPTNTARFMNTNTGIIGTMGTGKTQFTKALVTQLMRNQGKNVDGGPIGMLIFDYKSDYVDDAFCQATQAKKYKLHNLPYNPLALYGDMPMLPVHTAAGFSETMAKAYGLGKKQQLKLENLILACYNAAGIHPENAATWNKPAPTLEDVWQLFLSAEKVEEDALYAALSKLARLRIFEADVSKLQSLYDLTQGVVVIELASYPPEVQNLIVGLTLDLFYSQMQKRGKPVVRGHYRQITKMVLVDEADNFMSQDFSALRKILKEGREYGVGVLLSTQDITHFKTSDNDYSAYILTWIVHRVSQIKNADIKAIFNIDDKSGQDSLMETIRKLDKHYSLYIDGDKTVRKMRDTAFWELGL